VRLDCHAKGVGLRGVALARVAHVARAPSRKLTFACAADGCRGTVPYNICNTGSMPVGVFRLCTPRGVSSAVFHRIV